MANYRVHIPLLRKFEGGLSRNPKDNAAADPVPDGQGYHTNKGITWSTFKGMARAVGYSVTRQLFYQMPDWVWEGIYKVGYWNPVGGDHLKSQGIADMLVDFAFNSGAGTAVRYLQRILNNLGFRLDVDGKAGPRTVAAANSANQEILMEALYLARKAYYRSLNDTYFLPDWLARLEKLFQVKKKSLPVVPLA